MVRRRVAEMIYRPEPKGWRIVIEIDGRNHGSPWLSSPEKVTEWEEKQITLYRKE